MDAQCRQILHNLLPALRIADWKLPTVRTGSDGHRQGAAEAWDMDSEVGNHQAAPGAHVQVDLHHVVGCGSPTKAECPNPALTGISKRPEVAFQSGLQRVRRIGRRL